MLKFLKGKMGFLNVPPFKIASNCYMPAGIHERVCYSKNMFVFGNGRPKGITGGGISFDQKQAEISAFGEFIERYSSSFVLKNGLKFGNYNELSKKYNCLEPSEIRYFSPVQFNTENFKMQKLSPKTKVHWINSWNWINSEEILLPFFMTNMENIEGDGFFHVNTSTGTAAHTSVEKAIESGLLECIERDAFCKFWYYQGHQELIKYSELTILKKFGHDKRIEKLFRNDKIKIITFDLGKLSYCPTFAVIILFKKGDKLYQSVGSSSRLDVKEALLKACLEAYQGIEYTQQVVTSVDDSISPEKIAKLDFTEIKSFEHHYALYNLFPELCDDVPVLKSSRSERDFTESFTDNYNHHIKSLKKKELTEKGIGDIYCTNLTTVDVEQMGFCVVKVTTPKMNLLTGDHRYQYLGLFDEKDLFVNYPHPFP